MTSWYDHEDQKDHEELKDHKDPKDQKDHNKNRNCVKETLKQILKAQNKAKEKDDCCKISCKHSIDELLGKSCTKTKKNTIPFILYCKGDCDPFKATGITAISREHHSKKKKFVCFETFIFRIKDLDDKCAVLELLVFKFEKKDHKVSCTNCKADHVSSPCCQVDWEDVDDLVKTGVCINVDLSCFCAITCLPAVSI
ncbi:CotY/CotZ family spore coat protein [Bacillus methanolicus]|uniref:Spore coat protein Z n=1 Tax=Bacillus methanolicus (strain MGA3 / ATCC 53907) TaxID=796606 RepID=I3DU29_BACMM|nr:CotY/CotZ family spore coat protein [Bacillus methanolicus]AIE59848.1 hypothetical protein BMMGA3_07145 [Bacillus methanolicus MGA3]EIJ77750.1 spore coat protein [Bacillus methanolicus MGA3]